MIKRVKESPVIYEGPSVIGRQIVETTNLEYVHLTLDSNCNMEPHKLDIDVDFFIVSGSGSINIDGDKHEIAEGDFLRVNRGSTRALITNKKQSMTILVIKTLN